MLLPPSFLPSSPKKDSIRDTPATRGRRSPLLPRWTRSSTNPKPGRIKRLGLGSARLPCHISHSAHRSNCWVVSGAGWGIGGMETGNPVGGRLESHWAGCPISVVRFLFSAISDGCLLVLELAGRGWHWTQGNTSRGNTLSADSPLPSLAVAA